MKEGYYYLAYGWGDDVQIIDPMFGHMSDYGKALAKAIENHKQELVYQKEECGAKRGDEVPNDYVVYYDGNEYVVAVVSGWNCRVEEYELEDLPQ